MIDNTVHLLKKVKWYPKKRPNLQFNILLCLALRGKLSKGQAEKILHKRHGDIIDAFNKLEKKGFIKKSKSRVPGRGKIQHRYEITHNGLHILITDETTTSLSFWKIMYGYCNNHEKLINDNDIEKYFESFIRNYLKYKNIHFIDFLDIFENMSKEWINNFVASKNFISSEQKVLETLSLHPKLSFKDLVSKSKLNTYTLEKILYSHSMKFYPPIIQKNNKSLNIHENSIGKKNNPKYWDFMKHNIINITKNSEGEDIYELSLFGIVLIFKLIRFNLYQKEKSLYFGNISFIQYFEKIVKNYDTKLPLIFGKWNLLKQILKNYSIYNFDKITNEYFFQQDTFSISRGGNNEFFKSINEIILQTRQQLGRFADAGTDCYLICYLGRKPYDFKKEKENISSSISLHTYFPIINKGNNKNIKLLLSKYIESLELLNPVEQMIQNFELSHLNNNTKLLREFENSFADVLTAYYYFNLYFEYEFFYILDKSIDSDYPQSLMPKECLHQILKLDEDITIFYLRWYEDIMQLQNSITNQLKQPINFIRFKY